MELAIWVGRMVSSVSVAMVRLSQAPRRCMASSSQRPSCLAARRQERAGLEAAVSLAIRTGHGLGEQPVACCSVRCREWRDAGCVVAEGVMVGLLPAQSRWCVVRGRWSLGKQCGPWKTRTQMEVQKRVRIGSWDQPCATCETAWRDGESVRERSHLRDLPQ